MSGIQARIPLVDLHFPTIFPTFSQRFHNVEVFRAFLGCWSLWSSWRRWMTFFRIFPVAKMCFPQNSSKATAFLHGAAPLMTPPAQQTLVNHLEVWCNIWGWFVKYFEKNYGSPKTDDWIQNLVILGSFLGRFYLPVSWWFPLMVQWKQLIGGGVSGGGGDWRFELHLWGLHFFFGDCHGVIMGMEVIGGWWSKYIQRSQSENQQKDGWFWGILR